jgi:hypothetical protein
LGLALVAAVISAGAGSRLAARAGDGIRQSGDVTVRGCVERDAASRSPLFKLLEDAPGTRIFRLTFPKDIDVPSQVGHTVDVTGTVGAGGAQSHDPDLAVKKLTSVRDSCAVPALR